MKRRNVSIDVTKGLLAVGMVFAHVVQLLGNDSPFLKRLVLLLNLVSFSGFFFCFGFAAWGAYLSKPQIPWANVVRTASKCYFAFLLSGIAYAVLIGGQAFSISEVSRITLLREIPGYSEFLLSFSLIILLSCLAAPLIRRATDSPKNLGMTILLCLAVTLLPSRFTYDPLLGLLIGGSGTLYFPVISYLPLFLIGVFLARSEDKFKSSWVFIGAGGTLLFLVLTALKVPISRFPPSPLWILGSIALVFVYYGAGRAIARFPQNPVTRYFNLVGNNVLFYLLLSNLTLFVLKTRYGLASPDLKQTLIIYGILMVGLSFLQSIVVDSSKANKSLNAEVGVRE